jgi:hypothetical protein
MRKLLLAVGLFGALPLAAQAPVEDATLDEVVVSGEYPGPGMWKVTRPDDPAGHVLWIVADPPPLPKRLKWKSTDIETVARSAEEILRDSTVDMQPDEKIGLLRGMTLLPAILKARRNPGEATLQELLPADLYGRWLVQKKRYLGRERGVETWRPLFAATRLRKAAFDDLDLREGGVVWDVIGKLAHKHHIKVSSPTLRFTFKRSDVRAKLKEFSSESLADVDCFKTTLDLTEALADRQTQNARARAWATGDLQMLAQLPPLPSPNLPCAMAVLNSQVAREVIPSDIREQVITLWLQAASQALGANKVTLAIVPLVKLTREQGYLARLSARGYLIEAPQ